MAQGPSLGGQTHEHTEADITDLDHNDPDAIHDNVAGEINAITSKGTPVDADLMLLEDSEASWAKKKVQLVNLSASGDIKYSSGDATTGVSYSTTEATLATKTLDITAGDMIRVDIWYWSEDATTDDYMTYCDLDGQFTVPTAPAALNATGDVAHYTTTWINVVSSSQVYHILVLNPSPNTMSVFPSRNPSIEVINWMWEDLAVDVTGTKTLAMHVKASTGAGTIYWAAQIRQWAEVS